MIPRYAGVGIDCPKWIVSVATGGNLSASGAIYFSFQLMNRAGLNRASYSTGVFYGMGDKIVITIPAEIHKEAWDIHYFVLSASTTDNPESFVQIARLPAYQWGVGIEPQVIPAILPAIIELTEDEHLLLAPSINTRSELPTGAKLINGMARWILDESLFVEYQAEIQEWQQLGNPNTYILNPAVNGSDRNLTTIDPTTIIAHPLYPPSLNTKVLPAWESKYFLYNNSEIPLSAGTEFGIELSFNNKRSTDLLNGLFLVKFNGFASEDGQLRTTDNEGRIFANTGGFVSWEPKIKTPFITEDDLLPGESISISVKPFFSTAELNNQVPPGSVIGILPVIRTQSGDYNPLGKLLASNVVYAKGGRYRVLPEQGLSFSIASGNAIVAGYDFPLKPKRTISGLQENTANQKVIINGNGAVFLENSSYNPTSSEDLRALISTEAGESSIGNWSTYLAIAENGGISGTILFDNVVRSDYPDVIAGSIAGNNASKVYIYIERQSDSETRRFGFLSSGINTNFNISDWSSGIQALPSNPGASFSLFAPGDIAISEIAGNFMADNYRAAVSFGYEGTEITAISHNSPPCIQEYPGDFTPPSITVGEVYSLPPDSVPSVVNTSVKSNEAVLDFYLIEGQQGIQGEPGQQGIQGEPGADGADGAPGMQGIQGEPGADGAAATLDLGEVNTVNPDQSPSVVNSGSSSNAVIDFFLPRAVNFTIGTVSSGSSASVRNVGTDGDVILDFVLQKGAPGTLSSTSGLFVTGMDTTSLPATGENQYYLFINQATNELQIKLPNNKEIVTVGSVDGGDDNSADRSIPFPQDDLYNLLIAEDLDLSNGDSVILWQDRMQNSNPEQTDASIQPIFITNVFGNLPGIYFDGGTYLTFDLTILDQSYYSIVLVEKPTGTSEQYFIGHNNTGQNASLHLGYFTQNTSRFAQYANDLDVDISELLGANGNIWIFSSSSRGKETYLNGNLIGSNTNTDLLTVTQVGNIALQTGIYYKGYIGLVGIYKSEKTVSANIDISHAANTIYNFYSNDFDPLSIFGADLIAWYRADEVILNGIRVSQWSDKSGNNNHAVQTDNNLQPVYNSTGFNGRPTLEFDYTYYLELPNCLQNDWGEASLFCLLDLLSDTKQWNAANTGNNISDYWGTNSQFAFAGYFGEFRNNRLEALPENMTVTGQALIEVVSSNSGYTVNRNAIEKLFTVPDFGVTSTPFIGISGDGGRLMPGSISEFFIVKRAANNQEINSARDYLKSYWDLTIY